MFLPKVLQNANLWPLPLREKPLQEKNEGRGKTAQWAPPTWLRELLRKALRNRRAIADMDGRFPNPNRPLHRSRTRSELPFNGLQEAENPNRRNTANKNARWQARWPRRLL